MPEGPEIWRTADKLDDALAGQPVEKAYFAFEELKPYEDRLQGRQVERVEARGKALLTFFEGGRILFTHNQLYGKWYLAERDDRPETNRQLRVALHSPSHSAFLFSASDIEILKKENLDKHEYLSKLGPDVLYPGTDSTIITGRFFEKSFQNRKLSTLLLDQGFLAGVGNYLRSEIMFFAGIDPDVKLCECTDREKEMLGEGAQILARRSYRTGGITVKPKIVEALERENADRVDIRRYVYKRTGRSCHQCGSVIEEKKTGGRKIYYCPNCQAFDSRRV